MINVLCVLLRHVVTKKIVDRLVRSIDKEKMLHKGLKWSNKRTELLLDVIAKAFNANAVKKDILVGAYAQ